MQGLTLPEIDKYKRKYRGNISVGKFSRDFTDENISSVYTEGITVGKNIIDLPTELLTEFIPLVNSLVKL
jgi:hypothetical protein